VLLAGVQFLWELVRFLGLFLLALLRFRGLLVEDPSAVLWLLALGSAQLLAPAALALFLYSPARRAALLPFLRLAKILQLFPVLLLTLALALPGFALSSSPNAEGLARPLGLARLPAALAPMRLVLAPVLLASLIVDLLFLFVLFSPQEPARTDPP
jgi:hypothetical protein